jgi:radical SAM family uncharacterized protein/radical SAM-linked protein
MTDYKFEKLLPGAEKPSRYIGAEVNSIRKANAAVRFLLAFPDTYEVGMSHLGLQILYSVLNAIPDVAAERCFAVWPDREAQLRSNNLPLTSLETQTPIADFDVVGFSLQYELSFTNVLSMLELGGIPLRRADRRPTDPLIIAGGPCSFNPAPLTEFMDAFVVGEGEEVVAEITGIIRRGKENKISRAALILQLAQIPGIYVPAVHNRSSIIKKRNVIDINLWPHPQMPVVPLMQTIHDRIILEIARGCTRGCRFCQAGMIWRPYRERDSSLLMKMAEDALNSTGHDEISLLSLSSGDYSCIEPLIQNLMLRHYSQRVALALPSLRVESLSESLIEEIRKTRKTSFTLAPEAGTERMRQVINKGNTAEDLLGTVDKVFRAGWKSVKLYFMIGLPGETREDLEGIIDLAYQALRAAKNRGQITISLSTFVPKPHTPFQWHRQISLAETSASQDFIRQRVRNRNLAVKWHDARMSMLEGIFSRGDEKLAGLLETAFRKGCRFDGWTDLFRFDLWQEALNETGINPEDYTRSRDIAEALPWDNIDCGVSREFLLTERQKAVDCVLTADCRFTSCQDCGVCDFRETKNIFAAKEMMKTEFRGATTATAQGQAEIYRFSFTKVDQARFLSHLELSMALIRALRRSRLSLSYSGGFHPHPRISFGTATAVGMESREEYMDVSAGRFDGNLNSLIAEINTSLPHGIAVSGIRMLAFGDKDLARALYGFNYEFILPADIDQTRLITIEEKINNFLQSGSFSIERKSKDKTIIKDIRPFVEKMTLDSTKREVKLLIRHSQQGAARPIDILVHVLGLSAEESINIRVVKTMTILA